MACCYVALLILEMVMGGGSSELAPSSNININLLTLLARTFFSVSIVSSVNEIIETRQSQKLT